MTQETSDLKARDRLISELKWEIDWQWKWEKKYRRFHYYTILLSWLSAFLIMAICAYQLQLINAIPQWTILANVFLSTLSVSLPSLSNAFRFQQRQEVYDRMARTYTLLNTKLEMGAISTEAALHEFELIHLQPTEKVIRETA